MSHWEERITSETPPAIRAEHELRYRLVAPLIAQATIWADLGCGNAVASAAALEDRRPPHAVLVDMARETVAQAADELEIDDTVQISGDLTDPAILDRIGESLLAVPGERIVTCFEVVEHLSTFVPLLEWAARLAADGEATFVMSVPNDAFWAIENPFHASRWSEGAFEELRRLLPTPQTLLRQVALTGSAMVPWDDGPRRHSVTVDVGGRSVASHFLAAFGPRHREIAPGALAVPVDQLEQRRWERQRESNLAHSESQIVEWRGYIHELERELGLPLSGGEPSHSPQ